MMRGMTDTEAQISRSSVQRERIRPLKDARPAGGPVLYWMSRDRRTADNWALLFAAELAVRWERPFGVVFALAPAFLGACLRQYAFMLAGLREVERELHRRHVPFRLLVGDPGREVARLARDEDAAAVVCDFDPLRIKQAWQRTVARAAPGPVYEVDAHNVVPCREASDKQEYAAYTIRPKIHRLLDTFLVPYPKPNFDAKPAFRIRNTDWSGVEDRLRVDHTVGPVDDPRAGTQAGMQRLAAFLEGGLQRYDSRSNDPTADAQSGLSPYLHFGQLSAQTVALQVRAAQTDPADRDAFLEQLIVRRELSDNFCLHNPDYDTPRSAPAWAAATLEEHAGDRRPYLYDRATLEAARTHDPLWNAAQAEMVSRGTMHGYLRMYWAKKILEWTRTAAEAHETALALNDRYELDGRDPNGYVGVAWSIGGVHDRPWKERPVFGKIRFMSDAGCRRKFDTDAYIARWSPT